jgi:hypothetical protein
MILLTAILLAHSFYDMSCCSERDCHPVPCAEIHGTGNGWEWHGRQFTRPMLKASPDNGCHVCLNNNATFCVYLPSNA